METKEKARQFIENGGKCIYRYGYAWKGAGAHVISKEEAIELLPKYSFGKGFYVLDWLENNGERILEFNEFSENDMW